MDNNEEYIIRVLHRTFNGLQDSLTPVHGRKLKRLVERFEGSGSFFDDIQRLMTVHGFAKAALAMEWLYLRTQQPQEEFSLEQFESDVLLLNEKFFDAFLNQPFEMPNFGNPTADEGFQPDRHQQFQISADEFVHTDAGAGQGIEKIPMETVGQYDSTVLTEGVVEQNDGMEMSGALVENNAQEEQTEYGESAQAFGEQSFEETIIHSSVSNHDQSDYTPPLADIIDSGLFEMINKVAQSAIEFGDKSPKERPIAASVLRVTVRAGLEESKSSNNVIAQEFFQAMVGLINMADELGKIKSEAFADAVRDVGDRLHIALQQSDSGVILLKNITAFISEPIKILGKK